MIAPSMTLQGYFILLFCSETVDKDCPKARSGGAALAAARVLNVPLDMIVSWMKEAEKFFARDVPIAWLHATEISSTFIAWLGAARRSGRRRRRRRALPDIATPAIATVATVTTSTPGGDVGRATPCHTNPGDDRRLLPAGKGCGARARAPA